jgi:hypothetical protein
MNNRSLEARDRIAFIGFSLVGIPFRVCERRERRCDKVSHQRPQSYNYATLTHNLRWKPEEQICPTSLRMKKYFGSSEYNEYMRYKAGGMPTRVWIDWQQAHERFAAIL